MKIPFDELWTPEEMSDYLTGDYDLVRDINAAILAGKLAAERREYKYTPPTPAPWELAQRAMFGYTPEKIEPKTITIPQIKPLDAVAWAINAGVVIHPDCLDEYEKVSGRCGHAAPGTLAGHSTQLLEHLAAAAERFWKNYDPTDYTTAPTNETVAAWLMERGVAGRVADIMAQILRADGIPPGPRK